MLKTSAYGLGFQHFPRDPANVNAWKTMFVPNINDVKKIRLEVIDAIPLLVEKLRENVLLLRFFMYMYQYEFVSSFVGLL